tara:strand:+ start:79 stop:612 length:534 start_codon:yes stop_codon:yes gene_type:complete
LGTTAPKVLGHEYYVDAIINVTDFDDSQASLTANFTSGDNNMVIVAGTVDVSKYTVGQNLILAGTVESFSGVTVAAIDSQNDTITLSSVTGNNANDSGVTISTDQEVIPYSSFGLSKVTQVSILGQENDTLLWNVELGTDGATKIADHLVLKCNTASSGAQGTGDVGTIRVRLFGLL